MAERLDADGYPDPCGSCMATEAPMVFAGSPWCSDDCRKQMLASAAAWNALQAARAGGQTDYRTETDYYLP